MVSGASGGRFKDRMIDKGLRSSSVPHMLDGRCWLLAETLTLGSIGWSVYTLRLRVIWAFIPHSGFQGEHLKKERQAAAILPL